MLFLDLGQHFPSCFGWPVYINCGSARHYVISEFDMLWVFKNVENYFCHSGQLIWRSDCPVLLFISEMFVLLFVNTLRDSTRCVLAFFTDTACINTTDFLCLCWLNENNLQKEESPKNNIGIIYSALWQLLLICWPALFSEFSGKGWIQNLILTLEKSKSHLLPDKPVSH